MDMLRVYMVKQATSCLTRLADPDSCSVFMTRIVMAVGEWESEGGLRTT